MCLYAGLDEAGDDVQVHVISTQVREIDVIGWVESLTDLYNILKACHFIIIIIFTLHILFSFFSLFVSFRFIYRCWSYN